MYTRLFLIMSSAPLEKYTEKRLLIKNVYHDRVNRLTNHTSTSNTNKSYARTIQDDCSYLIQRKYCLSENTYTCVYKHKFSELVLFLNVCERMSLEEELDVSDLDSDTDGYHQIVRDYIFCRDSGIRIALERRYDEYIDPDNNQMDYDCFNRYPFECYIHVEYEFEKNRQDLNNVIDEFLENISADDIIYRLLYIVSNKNINCVSDEIINIKNMALVHKYGYVNLKQLSIKKMQYFSLKYDGIRKNFCIFSRYIQIDRECYEFENHWFGQVIIGHCELVDNQIIIIDIYLISENFQKIAKKYNISYTGALQNYHQFYSNNIKKTRQTCTSFDRGDISSLPLKTQDEYFHMKRMMNRIKFIEPIEAINVIRLLSNIWKSEPNIADKVRLQRFHKNLKRLYFAENVDNIFKIDGFLGYNSEKIYKIKRDLTVDMVFKFDEMFRFIFKKMKANNQDLKKMITYANIQKTLNWFDFDRKYPGKFDKYAKDFIFFSNGDNFTKHYAEWSVHIDIEILNKQLSSLNSTLFILLMEFDVDAVNKRLNFVRLRFDKFSANTIKVFQKILKQF